jgi:parallel beta-helix repeat protein
MREVQMIFCGTLLFISQLSYAATIVIAPSNYLNSKGNMENLIICSGVADDKCINTAISKLPPAGGVVKLLSGTYNLTASIRPKDNVMLIGAGHQTILKHPRQITTYLREAAKPENTTIEVQDSSQFTVGMQILIRHEDAAVKSTIKAINHNTRELLLDNSIAQSFEIGSLAIHAFPVIDVDGIKDNKIYTGIVIKDLRIDGNKDFVPDDNWLHSAITFWKVQNSKITGLHIDSSSSDGISDQGFGLETKNIIEKNIISNSRGNGIHIGTGYINGHLLQNQITRSGKDGVYFCLGIQNTIVLGNNISYSSRDGIGGIDCCYENPSNGDQHNTIAFNIIKNNKRYGIDVFGASYNSFIRNQITENTKYNVRLVNGTFNIFDSNIVTNNPRDFYTYFDTEHQIDSNELNGSPFKINSDR